MKIRKKNINFRFKKSKLKSKTEKSIMQRSWNTGKSFELFEATTNQDLLSQRL